MARTHRPRRRWPPPHPSLTGYEIEPGFRGARLTGRLLGIFLVLVPLITLLIAGVALPVTSAARKVAEPYTNIALPEEAPEGPQTTFVYDRKGRIIARLHAGVNRTVIPGDEIPRHFRHAVVAVEDRDFYEHRGIDTAAIVRAALADLNEQQIKQGGSTITQQYIKNVYTDGEKSFDRKIREAILATQLEERFTKDEILTKYLNTVYFGHGAYGVQAAAQTYFGRPARKLNVLQSATLAALIPAPARYDPITNPDAAVTRRNEVLRAMVEEGYVEEERAARLRLRPLKLKLRKPDTSGNAYFVDWVSQKLVKKYGYDATFSGGLRVTTTLDSGFQRAAEEAVNAHLPGPKGPSAALVAIDPGTGEIRAMVGGRDFDKRKFNLAVQARRSTGSAFKPFTLIAALEQDISLNSRWKGQPEMVIEDERCLSPKKEPWEVHTYEDQSFGTMDLVRATQYSVNTAYAQLVVEVGPDSVADVAKRMGIRSKLEPVCSITLGSQGASPLDMTHAYATLAARGIRRGPQPIARVASPEGEVLQQHPGKGKRVLDQNDADAAIHVLERVVSSGTGTRAAIGRPAAGKTGTAQDHVDAWFCGFIPQMAACVWVGYPKGEIPIKNVGGFPSVFGGSIPAMIWHDFMEKATKDMKVVDFADPDLSQYETYPPGTRPAPPKPPPRPEPAPPPRQEPPERPEPPRPRPRPSPRPSPPPSPPGP